MQLGLWQSLPPFRPSVRPPHRELVSSGERYSFFVVYIFLIVLIEVRVSGGVLFILGWI